MSKKFDISIFFYSLALFSGISYLWGFWIKFDLNILSYVAITDIVKVSVYPALPAIGALGIYSAIDGFNTVSKKQYDEDLAKSGKLNKGFTYFLKFYGFALVLLSLGGSAYTAITEDGYMRLRGLYPLISMILFLYIIFSNKFLLNIPVKLRVFVVSIVCFLPTVAFNTGYSNGEVAVDHGAEGFYVVGAGQCSSTDSEKFRYISVLGSRLFTISSKDNNICITKSEDFRLIKYNEDDHKKELNADSEENSPPVS
ncbi:MULTISPECIES: hypothetical protein [unclassified Microbulbifer]|uniref:hypothetical protein n=1 Tax=unclassified Microbulbifer TaxID=2619833 RepID=UPI0027E4B0E3|nr:MULTISPECIES: hypothetical protein [unclassified Microbulbifer]